VEGGTKCQKEDEVSGKEVLEEGGQIVRET